MQMCTYQQNKYSVIAKQTPDKLNSEFGLYLSLVIFCSDFVRFSVDRLLLFFI